MAEPTMAKIGEFRNRVVALVHESTNDMRHLVFNDSPQHMAVALLYCTIIQSASECLVLLAQPTISVPGMIRGIFESYADLCAVIKDSKYSERMLATFYYEKQRHLESMIEFPTNVYHADVAKHLDPVKELVKVKTELKAIEDRGYKRFSNRDRFVAADLLEEYQSLYWQLCLDSHNSVNSLEGRHIEKTVDGGMGLVLCKDNVPSDLARYYDALVGVLLDSAIKIHRLMDTKVASTYEERLQELAVFRQALVGV